jgi:hypothetical protein
MHVEAANDGVRKRRYKPVFYVATMLYTNNDVFCTFGSLIDSMNRCKYLLFAPNWATTHVADNVRLPCQSCNMMGEVFPNQSCCFLHRAEIFLLSHSVWRYTPEGKASVIVQEVQGSTPSISIRKYSGGVFLLFFHPSVGTTDAHQVFLLLFHPSVGTTDAHQLDDKCICH